MSDEYTIKITGIKARTGSRGRIRFSVCIPQRGFVEPRFPQGWAGCTTWLTVDDQVFDVAAAVYLASAASKDRLAHAQLRLANPRSCDDRSLDVDDIEAIWLADPLPPAVP